MKDVVKSARGDFPVKAMHINSNIYLSEKRLISEEANHRADTVWYFKRYLCIRGLFLFLPPLLPPFSGKGGSFGMAGDWLTINIKNLLPFYAPIRPLDGQKGISEAFVLKSQWNRTIDWLIYWGVLYCWKKILILKRTESWTHCYPHLPLAAWDKKQGPREELTRPRFEIRFQQW